MNNADPQRELRSLVRETHQLLCSLQAAGGSSVIAGTRPPAGRSHGPASAEKILAPLREAALACRDCRLSQTRTHGVFGEGSPQADLVFVGEGPGREEDLQGRPFVGAAGDLLNRLIQAMGMRRESVYIANVVKCRPPQNRPPEPDEIAACRRHLKPQLAAIRPRVICALGRTAANALGETSAPMSELRGRQMEWNGIPVVATFHPAYLLRNPSAKKEVWEDMQQVLALLGTP